MSLAPTIEAHIRAYLDSDDPRLEWVRDAVRRWHFLPLDLGWTAALGIEPDGTVVRWDYEDHPERAPRPEPTPLWQRLVLAQGARDYPELSMLLPSRPANAIDCPSCNRTGKLPAPFICSCGGLGWILEGDWSPDSPG